MGTSSYPLVGAAIRYELTTADCDELQSLIKELTLRSPSPATPEFYDQAWWLYSRLPGGLREFLYEFRRAEPSAVTMLTGFPVDDCEVGPTPPNWRDAAKSDRTLGQEIYLGLVGIALGEAFTWSTLQAARMIHNVLPIAGEEQQQSGHGSSALLEWHTEDGFHPNRCDYLLLLGIRNHDQVPTTVASVRDVLILPEQAQILAQRRFFILPDNEHLRQLASTNPHHPGLSRMQSMLEHPEPVSVLFGNLHHPYLRIDPFFMRCADYTDAEAYTALDALIGELEKVQQAVVVEAGSLLVIDNYAAVHGRKAFTPRYDGKDRWLKKLSITRDLRKSRDQRRAATDRVLF